MEHVTTDIGSRLRQARELRGLTIRDIANTTKISAAALTAIEQGDFARLPGGVFSRAYVRSFATEVGLDADEITREYRARFETATAAVPLPRHRADWSWRGSRIDRWSAVLVTVGILSGGAAILQRAELPQEFPDERSTRHTGETDRPEDMAPTTEEIALANAAVGEADVARPVRLEIRPHRPCWVSAAADGERVVYRLMQPGERTLIEARTVITLRVGDAGAFAYSINGATGRPLGGDGEVVTISITRENLGRLSAAPVSAGPARGGRRLAL